MTASDAPCTVRSRTHHPRRPARTIARRRQAAATLGHDTSAGLGTTDLRRRWAPTRQLASEGSCHEPSTLEPEVPFDLAEIKLAAPFIRPGTVAKADVIARLCASRVAFRDRGRARRVRQDDAARAVGRGRSASVRVGRARRPGRRRAGVPAIHRGRDPPRRAGPARGVRGVVRAGGSTWTTRVPRVGSALAGLERPLVLVLDDLHAIASPSCLDVLAALLEYVPAGSQIAIASREAPALPLGRWRAQGRVQEIGVADLRLDEREAKLLLEAAGVELDASELSELTEQTEGWPAGLYLAALSMQAGAPSVGERRGLHRTRPVRGRVLPRRAAVPAAPRPRRSSSSTPSVLDRMCGGLCDAVLQTTRSADTLEALERTNCFVVPLDRQRRVVSLPPPVRRVAAQRARAQRAGRRARAEPPGDGPGASPTT